MIFALFARFPALRWAAGFVAGLAVLSLGVWAYNGWVERRYEAKVSAQAQKAARVGAEAAASAAAETRNEVENSNADARKAAIGSDDPLRSGLDRLRTGAPAPRSSPR